MAFFTLFGLNFYHFGIMPRQRIKRKKKSWELLVHVWFRIKVLNDEKWLMYYHITHLDELDVVATTNSATKSI